MRSKNIEYSNRKTESGSNSFASAFDLLRHREYIRWLCRSKPPTAFYILTSLFLLLTACGSNDDDALAPKPRAYFRLTFPEKKYVLYDSVCPFTFEIPVYSKMGKDAHPKAEPCWLNLNFPTFNGTLHLSYKPVQGNINTYLEDTYELASKHQIKASGIAEQLINNDSNKVYGLLYDIEGNAASSVQFFLTDSTKHFIRGALYFNVAPNTDSIAPVVSFIKKDIYHLIETFKWKEGSADGLKPVQEEKRRGK